MVLFFLETDILWLKFSVCNSLLSNVTVLRETLTKTLKVLLYRINSTKFEMTESLSNEAWNISENS